MGNDWCVNIFIITIISNNKVFNLEPCFHYLQLYKAQTQKHITAGHLLEKLAVSNIVNVS